MNNTAQDINTPWSKENKTIKSEKCPSTIEGPIPVNSCLVWCPYKDLVVLHEGWFLVRYYNCGMHVEGFAAARAKYNSLRRLSAKELAE
jgi:hypothetical protein